MKWKQLISLLLLFFSGVYCINAQGHCQWKRVTKISNKILNDPKIKRGIWEENDGKTQSLHFGADGLIMRRSLNGCK